MKFEDVITDLISYCTCRITNEPRLLLSLELMFTNSSTVIPQGSDNTEMDPLCC